MSCSQQVVQQKSQLVLQTMCRWQVKQFVSLTKAIFIQGNPTLSPSEFNPAPILFGIWLIGFAIFQLGYYCVYGKFKVCRECEGVCAQERQSRSNECAIDIASDWNNTVAPPIQPQPHQVLWVLQIRDITFLEKIGQIREFCEFPYLPFLRSNAK